MLSLRTTALPFPYAGERKEYRGSISSYAESAFASSAGDIPFMSQPHITPEERFAAIIEELRSTPDVTAPSDGKGFGASGLKIRNKIFAMLARGKLVVKLPKSRVDALVAAGDGERFDPRGDGRVMKEWVVIEAASELSWLALAREAMAIVATQ